MMPVINGKPTKFEGVYIFVNFGFGYFEKIRVEDIINSTYNILQLEANITKESLMTKTRKLDNGSCKDIIDLKDNCRLKAINESNERRTALNGMIIKTFCSSVVIIFILGVTYFVIINKKLSKVSPLPEDNS